MVEWKGVKVGLLGLAEANWYRKLTTVDTDYWEFSDTVEEARRQARFLRVTLPNTSKGHYN